MLQLLLVASLLNGGASFTYAGRSILMVGTDNGDVISWSSLQFRSMQDCREAAKEVAGMLEEAQVPMQVQLYCTAAPHYT